MSRDQTLYQMWPKSNNMRRNYWWFSTFSPVLRHAMTLTWPLIDPWLWTFIPDCVSHDQTLYQIWAKSRDNQRLSYWSFSKFSHFFHPPPCKIRGGVGEIFVSCSQAQPSIESLMPQPHSDALPSALSRALPRAKYVRGNARDSASQNVSARFSDAMPVSFQAYSLLLDFPFCTMATKRNVDNVGLISLVKEKHLMGCCCWYYKLSEFKTLA